MNALAVNTAAQVLPLAAWLEVIDTLYPAHGAIVVGAGTGNGVWVQWLRRHQKPHVWLVEADESQCRHLLHHVPDDGNWTVRCNVVADTPQPVIFYRASNPAESGLIPPQHLHALWPHLAETAVLESANAATLNDLLTEAGQHLNWLFVDCLPAGRILQGAGDTLDQLNVICVRVIANGYAQDVDKYAQQTHVDTYLRARGFVCAQAQSERHPGLVQAIYVRDPAAWRGQLAERGREIEALAEQLQGLQRDKAALAEQVAQAQALAQERAQAIEAANVALQQLQSEKAALDGQLAQIEQQVAALAQARDEQAQRRQAAEQGLAERQREIEAMAEQLRGLQRDKAELAEQVTQAQALAQERAQAIEAANAALQQLQSEKAALDGQLAQLQQQLGSLAQARDEHDQQRQAAEKRLAERARENEALKADRGKLEEEKVALTRKIEEIQRLADERLKQVNDFKQQLEKLKAGEAEMVTRQQLMQQEITRAEAQLDLIKEILLREREPEL